MQPEDFCRWLQGMFDVSKLEELNEEQIAIVRAHLSVVFEDVTGYGMAGVAKKYRGIKIDPSTMLEDDEEMIDEAEDEKVDGSILGDVASCMQKDDSKQEKSDPNHKENAWKVDPSIKTVLTCGLGH